MRSISASSIRLNARTAPAMVVLSLGAGAPMKQTKNAGYRQEIKKSLPATWRRALPAILLYNILRIIGGKLEIWSFWWYNFRV